MGIHGLQQLIVDHVFRVILAHADFLGNNPLLLGHTLPSEVGHGNETQQGTQVLLKPLGALEKIASNVGGSECVVHRTVGRQNLQCAPVLGVKHLVLQKMGNPRRRVHPSASIPTLEAQVHPPIPGGKKGKLFTIFRTFDHDHPQAVGQLMGVYCLSQCGIFQTLHLTLPPFRSVGKPCPVRLFGPSGKPVGASPAPHPLPTFSDRSTGCRRAVGSRSHPPSGLGCPCG